MPLNGGGTASRVPGTSASPNTTIKSADYEASMDDIYQIFNTARPIAYGGTGATDAAGARSNLELDKKLTYAAKSANYTAVAADNNAVLRFTATATLSLTAAATLGSGWHVWVIADGGAVTIDPNGTEQVDGAATLVIPDGYSAFVVCDGASFFTDQMATEVSNLKTRFLHVRDQKATGVSGGDAIAGVQTRTLNTVVTNGISGASLSSNVITLPAGVYDVEVSAPAYKVGAHQVLIREVGETDYLLVGQQGYTDNGANDNVATTSCAKGRITLAATTDIEVVHYIQIASAGLGLGVAQPTLTGSASVYTEALFWKVD